MQDILSQAKTFLAQSPKQIAAKFLLDRTTVYNWRKKVSKNEIPKRMLKILQNVENSTVENSTNECGKFNTNVENSTEVLKIQQKNVENSTKNVNSLYIYINNNINIIYNILYIYSNLSEKKDAELRNKTVDVIKEMIKNVENSTLNVENSTEVLKIQQKNTEILQKILHNVENSTKKS